MKPNNEQIVEVSDTTKLLSKVKARIKNY